MLFEILANYFDAYDTPQHARQEVARQVTRYILGTVTRVPAIAQELRPLLPDAHVSALSTELRRLAWDQHVMTHYWRAFSSFLDTRDTHVAKDLGVPVADVYHMLSVLTPQDMDEYAKDTRDWRRPVISERDTSIIIEKLRRTVQESLNMMQWIWTTDSGSTDQDWRGFMHTEALRLIYRYEARCTISFMLHKCQSAIINHARNMIKKYNSPSHALYIQDTGAPAAVEMEDLDDDVVTKVADLEAVAKFQSRKAEKPAVVRTPARTGLITHNADGDEIDVLATYGRVHPSCESDVVASVFISRVASTRPHVARYLTIVAHGTDPLGEYMDFGNPTNQSDDAAAAKCCGVTKADMLWLRERAADLQLA